MKKKAVKTEHQAEARLILDDIRKERSVWVESIGKFFRKRREIPAYRGIVRNSVKHVRWLDGEAARVRKEADL